MLMRKMKRRGGEMERVWRFLFAMLCFFPFGVKAQESIDAAQFFSRALAGSDSLSPAFSSEKVRFPWIEAYDMRVRTNDFELNQNLYTLRLAPSTPAKRKAQKALSQHLNQQPDFEGQEAFCNQLADVYEDWLALYMKGQESELLRALDTINQDRRRILEKMAGAYNFDYKELLKLRTDESDLEIALNELRAETEQLKAIYGLGTEGRFTFSGFIDIDGIMDVLAVAPDSFSASYTADQYEKELINKELALEIAESRQILDFAEIRYEGPNMDPLRQQLSVGIAFRIPNSGNRRLKMQELKLEQQLLEREQTRDAAQREAELFTQRQELIRDINAYLFYRETISRERSQLQNLADQIARKEGFDPLLLLDIEARHIDTRLKAFRKWERILSNYLSYIEDAGRLCNETARNFLAR